MAITRLEPGEFIWPLARHSSFSRTLKIGNILEGRRRYSERRRTTTKKREKRAP
jgi:hypothetical protein